MLVDHRGVIKGPLGSRRTVACEASKHVQAVCDLYSALELPLETVSFQLV